MLKAEAENVVEAVEEARPDFLVPNFGNDWLSNAYEITLPTAVNWLPQGPVWWALLGVVFLATVYRLWRLHARYCANYYRRQALTQLNGIKQAWRDGNPHALLAQRQQACRQLAVLVRQVALTAWPRQNTASLVGQSWLDFLQQSLSDTLSESEPEPARSHEVKSSGVHKPCSADAPPQLLSSLSYLPDQEIATITEEQWQALTDWTANWIAAHKEPSALYGGEPSAIYGGESSTIYSESSAIYRDSSKAQIKSSTAEVSS